MISEEDFAAASDGTPEMAFVRLERKFRSVYETNLKQSDSSGEYDHFTFEYMNHVISAANALGLDIFGLWDVSTNTKDLYDEYKHFRAAVDKYTVQIQISHLRSDADSVTLDEGEKKHLRGYAEKMKELIGHSRLPNDKKERLYDKINAFIKELDRNRTPLQKFHDVVLALASTGADAAEELEPTWKWVKMAAAMLGVKQEAEQTKLPAPPKRIEPPKPKPQPAPPMAKKNGRSSLDDEIPF
jgi:hypothetical protein